MILQKEERLQRHLHRQVAQTPIVQTPIVQASITQVLVAQRMTQNVRLAQVLVAQRMIQNVRHQQRIQVVGKKKEVHIFNKVKYPYCWAGAL